MRQKAVALGEHFESWQATTTGIPQPFDASACPADVQSVYASMCAWIMDDRSTAVRENSARMLLSSVRDDWQRTETVSSIDSRHAARQQEQMAVRTRTPFRNGSAR